MSEPEYLTLAQVSEVTNISQSSLRNAIRRGRLIATKPSNYKIYIRKVDLVEFMERGKIAPKGA